MSKVAKWIFPAAGGKDGIVGTAKAVVGFMTGNAGLVMDGFRQVAGMGRKGDAQARQASILTLTLGETPREAVLGRVCTSGSLVDVFNFGGQYGTDKVTRCVALADHAIDGIEGFYVNEVYYPWVGEGQQAAFSNKLSFHFRNASPDGYEPPLHVQQNGGWTATDRLCGVTHIWIDWYVDDKVWPQGHPEFRFVLRGLRVYDPRFDPQFGYTGPDPQTWADRSSHRFSRNAKLLRYAYTRGIFAEGHHGDPEYLLIGRGLSEEEAPADRVIADANLCDELVDGVARYCADGVISASQPFIEVDGMFAAAMAGQIVQREGTVDVEAGQAKAVVATITDADLVTGEKVGFSRFLGDQDGGRLNTFIGRYIEPLLGWKDHSAPVLRDLNDIQADGGPRETTLPLALVTEVKQSLRVTEIARRLARLERRGNIVLPPRFAGLEEGDWIAWQSARRHKGATVRYRIEAYRQPENWRLYLTLREIASSAYGVPDPVGTVVTPPPAPTPIDALALSGVTAEAITLPGEDSALPAVRLRWDAPVDAAVLAIRAEVRRVGETEIAPTRTEAVNDGIMVATNGVAPKASLECRLVPIGDPSRPVLPSNWITVSTSGVVAGDLGPGSPVVKRIDDIVVDVQGLTATYGSTAAAAVSAAAADTARALAETAKQGAVDAKNESAAQAVASQTARQGSETAAAASQSSAQTASTKADEAGQKASAAEVARAAAATERALAESARTTAVAAAETATDASAQAEQAYELAAKTGALRPNLAINGGLEDGLTGLNGVGAVLYIEDSASWGRTLRVTPDGRATYIVLWPTIKHQPGAQITISGDSLMFADSGAAYFDLEALDATGNVLAGGDGPQSPVVGAHDFSDDPNRIQQHASSWTPPAGTVDLRPRGIFESVVNPTALGFRRLKVEQGGLPATAYTAERQVAETVARQKVEEAVRASQTAALATRQSLMEAQASAPANEFDGADMSQGVRPFPQRWSGPDNIPVTRGLNADGSLFVLKTGNGNEWAGVGLLMGSISLAGGPHNQIAGAPGAWRVFAGERIGIAADVRASSNTSTTMLLVPRYYNDAGEQISDLAQIRGQNFNGTYERVGAVIDVPGNGYIQIEAYLLRQGYQQGQYADAHIRKLTFARMAPSATALPIYGAPGGGVMAARLTSAEGVLATVEGRQQAWLQRRVIAGSAEAFAEMMALDENGVPTSAVNAGARRIGLWNPVDGGWIEVVSVADGRAKIDGAVDINVGTNAVTIRSAATGARIEMTGSRLSMYDG